MAEETAEGSGKKSSIIMTAVLLAAALLVGTIGAFAFYKILIAPRLSGEQQAEEIPVVDDAFPPTMQEVLFDKMTVSVATDDPDIVPPILNFRVALSCADPETAAKVEEKKSYFAAEILQLHQGRTRAELNDPLVRSSILEQIKQQSNSLLKRMTPELELKVIKAMHIEFSVFDL